MTNIAIYRWTHGLLEDMWAENGKRERIAHRPFTSYLLECLCNRHNFANIRVKKHLFRIRISVKT